MGREPGRIAGLARCAAGGFAGQVVTPGLVDCHSHAVFGGDRAREFEMRLNGASYAEIAAGGGGIASTVNATRQASESQLLESARQRIRELCRDGVTALEIKSGYGRIWLMNVKCCG